MKMINIWKHFKTICIHKYWVGYYCFKAGLYWQGITHDLSKFSPTEFIESVKYYQGTSSPIDACKKDKGYSLAWQHHKGRNKHHHLYWQDNFDEELYTHLAMPYKYNLEMLCDFLGAGRAYSGKDFTYEGEYDWWVRERCKKKSMNPINRNFIDYMMTRIKIDGVDILKNHALSKRIYAEIVEDFNKGER